MKRLFAIAALCVALSACTMPQVEDPNSLRARVLGNGSQTTSEAPAPEPTTPPATVVPVVADVAHAVSVDSFADPNNPNPVDVLIVFALAIGGVVGFYFFALWVHTLAVRRSAHG